MPRYDRTILLDWILIALFQLGGSAHLVEVAKVIWADHEPDLRNSGDLFFTWQYEMRWAAQRLRDSGRMKPVHGKRNQPWELSAKQLKEMSQPAS